MKRILFLLCLIVCNTIAFGQKNVDESFYTFKGKAIQINKNDCIELVYLSSGIRFIEDGAYRYRMYESDKCIYKVIQIKYYAYNFYRYYAVPVDDTNNDTLMFNTSSLENGSICKYNGIEKIELSNNNALELNTLMLNNFKSAISDAGFNIYEAGRNKNLAIGVGISTAVIGSIICAIPAMTRNPYGNKACYAVGGAVAGIGGIISLAIEINSNKQLKNAGESLIDLSRQIYKPSNH